MVNSDPPSPRDLLELEKLGAKLRTGVATRVELGRLEELLMHDECLEAYVRSVGLDVGLNQILHDSSEVGLAGPIRTRPCNWVLSLGAAVTLIMLFGLVFLWIPLSDKKAITSVGPPSPLDGESRVSVTGMTGVDWVESDSWQFEGGNVDGRRVVFDRGVVELTFDRGAVLLLEGPASFQATGPLSARLDYGRCFAEVPVGAKDFQIEYAGRTLVDRGAEFVLDVPRNGFPPEVAVLRGEVSVFSGKSRKGLHLWANDAIRHGEGTQVLTIPFPKHRFVREIPSGELAWSLSGKRQSEFRFNVSDLIRKEGSYRVVFKWMHGHDALVIEGVSLYRNGILVGEDLHRGVTGRVDLVQDNIYHLSVSQEQFAFGSWELRANVQGLENPNRLANSSEGILYFEEVSEHPVRREDFIGTWAYQHDGEEWKREIRADGSVILYREGRLEITGDSFWKVENGILLIWFPRFSGEHPGGYEEHLLRDPDTLLFLDQPFRNARKIK